MIKKMEVEDIAQILSIEDIDIEHIGCDKGQWVQWLIPNIENPDFFMMCDIEDGKLTGYIVAINAVSLPINTGVSILYSKTAGIKSNKRILKLLIEWAKEKNAKSIDFLTNNVAGHIVYGFNKKATLMTMEI